jgi:hypothetical protein
VLIRLFFGCLSLLPTCQMVMHCCYLSKIDYYMNQEAMWITVYKILKYCIYLRRRPLHSYLHCMFCLDVWRI